MMQQFLSVFVITWLACLSGVVLSADPFNVEVVVAWYNEAYDFETCTIEELSYVNKRISPSLDGVLIFNDYEPIFWQSEFDMSRRLEGEVAVNEDEEDRELGFNNCDWCKPRYSDILCNALFYCGFRRELSGGESIDPETLDDVAIQFEHACHLSLFTTFWSSYGELSWNCRRSLLRAVCETHYP